MALVIGRDGLLCDFIDGGELGHCGIESEALTVVREEQFATGCQQSHSGRQQCQLVTLYVEGSAHTFRIGKTRWIQDDQVELPSLIMYAFKKTDHVCLYEIVSSRVV